MNKKPMDQHTLQQASQLARAAALAQSTNLFSFLPNFTPPSTPSLRSANAA